MPELIVPEGLVCGSDGRICSVSVTTRCRAVLAAWMLKMNVAPGGWTW